MNNQENILKLVSDVLAAEQKHTLVDDDGVSVSIREAMGLDREPAPVLAEALRDAFTEIRVLRMLASFYRSAALCGEGHLLKDDRHHYDYSRTYITNQGGSSGGKNGG